MYEILNLPNYPSSPLTTDVGDHLRWTRYFYCSTLPALRADDFGWPQVNTTLRDHCQPGAHSSKLCKDSGKSFKSTDQKLPKVIFDRFAKMKMAKCKRAGTQSNQRSAAGSAWLEHHCKSGFRSATMSWSGRAAHGEPSGSK